MDWLEWNREVERNRHMLERIVALLFSLAGLADRACELRGAARLHVLGFLSHGEAEARAFVIGWAHETGTPVDEPDPETSIAAGDAERLAVSFRMLALVLGAMLAQAHHFARSLSRAARPQAGLPMRKPVWPQRRQRALTRAIQHAARGPPAGTGVGDHAEEDLQKNDRRTSGGVGHIARCRLPVRSPLPRLPCCAALRDRITRA